MSEEWEADSWVRTENPNEDQRLMEEEAWDDLSWKIYLDDLEYYLQ